MNVQEYCDTLNLEIVLTYFPNQKGRWCAKFANCEIKEDAGSCMLVSKHGNGKTPQSAIDEYISQIRGKVIVINAANETTRREYVVPESLT